MGLPLPTVTVKAVSISVLILGFPMFAPQLLIVFIEVHSLFKQKSWFNSSL